MQFDETIAAISTPIGIGGIGVIRVSGPQACQVADRLFRGKKPLAGAPSHTLHYGFLIDPASGERIDSVLAGVMLAPNSYTGLDTVELSCHGGPVNVQRVLELVIQNGARLAAPGEFTQIAYLNGKMDLAQVEAVADLIHARTEQARKSAASQFMGDLSDRIRTLRQNLVDVCSLIEIELDFAEENLISVDRGQVRTRLEAVIAAVELLLSTFKAGRALREGVRVSIIGRPNVGKSSVLNTLLGRDRAIVSEIPGTTRDFIEEVIDISGIPFVLVDTAGLRSTDDRVEKMGIRKTEEHAAISDVILVVLDLSSPMNDDDSRTVAMASRKSEAQVVFVGNKCDLPEEPTWRTEFRPYEQMTRISAKYQTGIEHLERRLFSMFAGDHLRDEPMISRMYHKIALENALQSLREAAITVKDGTSMEFSSVDIRNAVDSLGAIVGEISSDDVLTNIFSRFCIGK